MRILLSAAAAATFMLSLPAAGAAQQTSTTPASMTLSGVTMPGQVRVGDQTLVLNGMALRKKFIFKVYVAGMYLPERATSADAILQADHPRRMVLEFVRGVDKGKMCDAMQEGLAPNTPHPSKELEAKFEQLCSMMADVEKGQQFVFTYQPGRGTQVEVAGKDRGTIAGKDFADALWREWIGPKPGPGEDFKKSLLGSAS